MHNQKNKLMMTKANLVAIKIEQEFVTWARTVEAREHR